MGMKFTEDQQRVIDLRNCNILVSAAAGSGWAGAAGAASVSAAAKRRCWSSGL